MFLEYFEHLFACFKNKTKFLRHVFFFFLVIHIFVQIWIPSNPRGAERLPPGFIASESDLYLRRLWGNPEEVCRSKQKLIILGFLHLSCVTSDTCFLFSFFPQDMKKKPRYLATFTVGYKQRYNIDACVKKVDSSCPFFFFFFCLIVTSLCFFSPKTVFRQLYDCSVSLRWDYKRVEWWIWVVEECNTHQCLQAD